MEIVELIALVFGAAGLLLAIAVGGGILFSPIYMLIVWKYPSFHEQMRSFVYGGWVYKEKTEEELKKFAEWAGFKDTIPPTSP